MGLQHEEHEAHEEIGNTLGPEGVFMRKGVLPADLEKIVWRIIGCAIEVHRHLSPGLIERLYEEALVHELKLAGLRVGQQQEIVVPYKSIELRGQRLDLLVEDQVVVENKAVTQVPEIYYAQLLSYLRATGAPVGLLFNFNVTVMRDGIRRIMNDRPRPIQVPSCSS